MAWDDDEVIAKAAEDALKAHEEKRKPAMLSLTAYEIELRDQFAAQIIGGWCVNDTVEVWECDEEDDNDEETEGNAGRMKRYAENAYRMADAMLKARKA